MKTYQYKPDAPASACIGRINQCTHSLARRACIGQVRFHLPHPLTAKASATKQSDRARVATKIESASSTA